MFINICYRSGFDSEVIALSVAIKFDSDSARASIILYREFSC